MTVSKKMMSIPALVGLVAALCTAMSGVPSAAADGLTWRACPEDGSPMDGLQCATLRVPLDYSAPDGKTIELTMSKLPSSAPDKRRGTLFMNPGGPGSPALQIPQQLESLGVSPRLHEQYDVIGLDPRGVGRSTPVSCRLRPDQYESVTPYARNAGDVNVQADRSRQIARQCADADAEGVGPHITTANTARDMDRVREALGEQRISYLGMSYGTYLGAVYATLFPDRTDRIVLTSALGPGGANFTTKRRAAEAFENRFIDFADWVAARHDSYQLGRNRAEVEAKYFELASRLDQHGDAGSRFRLETAGDLDSEENWAQVAASWQSIDRGAGMPPSSQQPSPVQDNRVSAQLHVKCADSRWPRDVGFYQEEVAKARTSHPMFGPAAANINPCAFWPTDPVEPPVNLDAGAGEPNILIMHNLRDPILPPEGAQETRAALGQRARLVSIDDGGHGIFASNDNACANNTIYAFLLDGNLADDGRCPANR